MGELPVFGADFKLLARIGDIREIGDIVEPDHAVSRFPEPELQAAHRDRESQPVELRDGGAVERQRVVFPAGAADGELSRAEPLSRLVLEFKRKRAVAARRIGGEGDCGGTAPGLVNRVFDESCHAVLFAEREPQFAAEAVVAFGSRHRTETEIDRPGRGGSVAPAGAAEPAGDVGEIVQHQPPLFLRGGGKAVVAPQRRGVHPVAVGGVFRRAENFRRFPVGKIASGQVPAGGIPRLPEFFARHAQRFAVEGQKRRPGVDRDGPARFQYDFPFADEARAVFARPCGDGEYVFPFGESLAEVVALHFQHGQIKPRRIGSPERQFAVDVEQGAPVAGDVKHGGTDLFIKCDGLAESGGAAPVRQPDPARSGRKRGNGEQQKRKRKKFHHGLSFPKILLVFARRSA